MASFGPKHIKKRKYSTQNDKVKCPDTKLSKK